MSSHDKTLSQRAIEAAAAVGRSQPNPPDGNTGGISGHNAVSCKENSKLAIANSPENSSSLPQNTSPPPRASRATKTTKKMEDFLGLWFLDWLTLTIPNPFTGKGVKAIGAVGNAMSDEAEKRMSDWVAAVGLHKIRVGNGSDGFKASMSFGLSPVETERLGSIRSGHPTNMPSLEITGGGGSCDTLGRSALSLLGPVLVARADVSFDYSQEGLWDDLLEYAKGQTGAGAGKGMKAPRVLTSDCGRTFYWGANGVSVKVYEKDLERVARGKKSRADADENLVRVEFTFRPDSKKKGRFGTLTVPEMLGTSRWVRRMVEAVARLTKFAESGDTMAETKVANIPDATTIEDRAKRVVQMAAKTTIKAAASLIVESEFEGDWAAATVDAEMLEDVAIDFIRGQFAELRVAQNFIDDNGLSQVQSAEERSVDMVKALHEYLDRNDKETKLAKDRLSRLLQSGSGDFQAGVGAGVAGAV